MSPTHKLPLATRGVALYRSILSSSNIDVSNSHLREWLAYEQEVVAASSSGSLSLLDASAISVIVTNVRTVATGCLSLDQECDDFVAALIDDVQHLAVTEPDSKHQILYRARR